MAGENIWQRVRESIINKYEDQDHLTQQRAWFLYMFCWSCFFMFLLLAISNFAVTPVKAITPMVVAGASGCGIFLIRKGKYAATANTLLILSLFLLTASFIVKYRGPIIYDRIYSDVHFIYINIAFATLFCDRKAIIISFSWLMGMFITYFFAVKSNLDLVGGKLSSLVLVNGVVGITLCTILSLLIITAMRRANTRLLDSVSDVREASIKLTEVSSVIDASSQSVAFGAATQAAAMEETSAMLIEISRKTRKNTKTVMDAQSLMQDTAQIVNTANKSMTGLRSAMSEVNEASQQTVRVVKTIDSIAFQTNLLALNAAVEAARAGEAGAGFAVVADEVRRLAQKSAEASRNTQAIIGSSIENISKSTDLAKESDEAFSILLNATGKLVEHLKSITEASEEQSQGIAEIEKAVDNINTVIQNNSATAEETAAVSTELTAMADNVGLFVHKLDRLVKA